MLKRLQAALRSGNTIRGNALRIYVLQFITLAITMFGSILVAKTLGPEQKGRLDLFNLLRDFLVEFGLLGFGSGLLYHFVRKKNTLAQVHGTAIVFVLAVGALASLLGLVGLPLWQSLFAGLPPWAILALFFLSPAAFYNQTWSFILTGLDRAVQSQRNGMVFNILTFLCILMLYRYGKLDAPNLMFTALIVLVLNSLVCFGWIYIREPKLEPNPTLAVGSLRYGSTVFVGILANQLHFRIDQLMVGHWLGTGQIGLYALGVKWAEMLFLLDSAIITAALHRIGTASPEESYALTKRLFRVQLLISGGAGLVLAVIAYPMVMGLYGSAYQGAIVPLILLVPGTVAWSVTKLVSGMLTFNRDLAAYTTRAAVIGLLLNVLLNGCFLYNHLGIQSVALASSLSYLFVALLIGAKYRQIGVRPVAE